MIALWLTAGVFVVTYALIVSEKVDRTAIALLGGLVVILLGVFTQEEAFAAIDWNVIFLLAGMMSIANILRETGLFQWIALQAVRLGRGQPFAILAILTVVTAIASALLDNVTIVVLVAPVTLFVASSLQVSPVPFLISEILASNIGGTATLIGDPPNILIGSASGYDFLRFAGNLAPISMIVLVVYLPMAWLLFRRDLSPNGETIVPSGGVAVGGFRSAGNLDSIDASSLISDRILLRKGLIVMAGVIVGFLVHGLLHLQPATIAMTGAALLMLWTRRDAHQVLRDVEWPTLFFFIGLFILIEAVVRVGIVEWIAHQALVLTHGNVRLTSIFLLWFSAAASGVVDNIPYTATLIPIVQSLGASMPVEPLWWALALGACLGGNMTLVGASANVVVANLAARSGYRISFRTFLVYGLPVTLMSLVLSTAYIWLRYL